MITWPIKLIKDLARRRAVLFIGAGVSKNSSGTNGKRPPNWEEFLQTGLERCDKPIQHIKSLLTQKDYLTACELIKERLRDDFTYLLRDEFVTPQYQPADIHKYIFELDSRIVITQNFDKIYDIYTQTHSKGTVAIKNYYDSDITSILRDEPRVVLKVHGTVDEPNRMIFTRKDYGSARYSCTAFYEMLDAIALTHTFLFLGCSVADPDIRILLEKQAHLFSSIRPHYIAMPASRSLHEDYKRSLTTNMNLAVLTYDPDNHHQELTDSLKQLVQFVEDGRRDISVTIDW